jgi:Na+/pantothenate symporter
LLKLHIIPDLTLMLLEVPIVSVAFPMTSTALLLEVPTAAVMSTVPDPAAMVESSVEAATSIHHL